MKLLGLTGGIGSGKSSVSRLLESYGAYVIDADKITHHLERRGAVVWHQIREAFGWAMLKSDGELDRKRLGHVVFGNIQDRERLNHIVHPAVQAEIRQQIKMARERGESIAVLDVPLLIEGGLYQIVDLVWVVYVDPDDQVERIQRRDGISEEAAWQRVRAQMPLKDKLRYADQVIDNRGPWKNVEEVVHTLWQNVASGE